MTTPEQEERRADLPRPPLSACHLTGQEEQRQPDDHGDQVAGHPKPQRPDRLAERLETRMKERDQGQQQHDAAERREGTQNAHDALAPLTFFLVLLEREHPGFGGRNGAG